MKVRVVLLLAGLAGVLLCWEQVSRAQGNPRQARGKTSTAKGASAPAVDKDAPKGVYPTAHGVIKSITGSQLFVDVEEEHEMKFRLIRKTKFYLRSKAESKEIKASALEPGQTVDIDMQASLDGAFEAVRVTVLAAPAAK